MRQAPEIPWIEAAETPWGVRVLDVRTVTQQMIATSADPECAANALSYEREDGSAFASAEPLVPRVIGAMIPYRILTPARATPARTGGPGEEALGDGALFRPHVMEHKWAIFHRQGRIFFVRSWTRKLHVIAELSSGEGCVEVNRIRGAFVDDEEHPLFTTMVVDFLLRSHALGLVYPAPLPEDMEQSPVEAAFLCFHMFGNLALCATHEIIPISMPVQVLKILT